MTQFATYTIIPRDMEVAAIAKLAQETGQIVLAKKDKKDRLILSPALLPGYTRISLESFARLA